MDTMTQERLLSGSLVRVAEAPEGGLAFVPDPLPPASTLLALAELAPALTAAERALRELAALAAQVDGDGMLNGLLARREAVASVRLEGSRVTVSDLCAYEAGPLPAAGLPAAPESDLRAVLGYERALQFGRERVRSAGFSLRTLSALHVEQLEGRRGMQAVPGQFRDGDTGVALSYAPLLAPPPGELRPALEAFERYLHTEDDAPPLLRAGLLHYQFLALHPFSEATPQMARLLLLLALLRADLLPAPLLSVSAVLARQMEGYHAALRGVTEQGDWTGWMQFFLRNVEEAARDAAARLAQLAELRESWRAQMAGGRSPELLLHLVDSLFVSPFLTFPLAQQRTGGNYRAARVVVQRLAAGGIVQPAAGDAFRKVFVAGDVLRTVEE